MSTERIAPPAAGELSFNQEWAAPGDPRVRRGVDVGASGVGVWEAWGLGSMDASGRQFAWAEWWSEGRLPEGAPEGLAARIEAVGARHGFTRPPAASPEAPPPRRRRNTSEDAAPTWSDATRRVLGWAPGATPALARLAAASGLAWVEPIGIAANECWLGVRRTPGLPLERSPVLLCCGPNATTVATEARDALAALLWRLGPRELESERERILRAWPRIEAEVRAQSNGLGGEAAIERFLRAIETPYPPELSAPANDPRHLAAVAEILGRLDPGQAELRRRIAALGAGADDEDWVPPPAWSAAWAATRYVPRRGDADLAWAVASGPPSLDTGARLAVGHFVNVRQDWSELDVHLASRVAQRVPREGPIARALTAMVAAWERDERYDGLAHLDVAGECAVAGDFAAAAILLVGAGYWSTVRFGRANPVVAEAWVALHQSAGWDA